jgi:translation initiation factor 2 alpha subunit (eIF-2alpha)
MNNYYSRYKGSHPEIIPSREVMEIGISKYPDHIVVVRNDKIKGVGIFVFLSDATFARIRELDIRRVDVMTMMLKEHGPNIHFVLLAADSLSTILAGLRKVIKKNKPKTISWWDPDLKNLHIKNCKGE